MEKLLFTSESVTEGHPDKVCDAISDAILDALMEQDPMSRVACETATCTGFVLVTGEITTKAYVDIPKIVRDTVKEIGGEWRVSAGSRYENSPLLYKENGFRNKETAAELITQLQQEIQAGQVPVIEKVERKKETKNPPLLYNLAELQNDCTRHFKISPDETLRIAQ